MTPHNSLLSLKGLCARLVRLMIKAEDDSSPASESSNIVTSLVSLGATSFPVNAHGIDDRLNALHQGISLMSTSGTNCANFEQLNSAVIRLLHNPNRPQATDFLAPPSEEGYPFARRCTSVENTLLPQPQIVFNSLLKSADFLKHPNGVSSFFTALATLISLSLVRFNDDKPEYNETSPFLNLSPLYGVNDVETDSVRTKDGRGMLAPDCFCDDRLALYPSAVSALLILWNRNHNYIARRLLFINERKKWLDPLEYPATKLSGGRLAIQDDEIFEIARSINCVHFKNVVAEDFLKVIAGLPTVGPSAKLNLNVNQDPEQSKLEQGHASTIEFSLLHQSWLSMMSMQDLQRLEAEERSIAQLERGPDFHFADDDLARILQDATEQVAGSARARGVSSLFRTAEVKLIERARQWGVCSLNDFRKYLGLKAIESFEDWNPDPLIASVARNLYTNIDNLELYAGLQAEQSASCSLGYTMTYALLVDLVTTIRSDPRFTTEFTPAKLTRWGYLDCSTVPDNGAFGTWMPKILQRNLPQNYPHSNVYSVFPFTVPEKAALLHGDIFGPAPQLIRMVDTTQPSTFRKPVVKAVIENIYQGLSAGYECIKDLEMNLSPMDDEDAPKHYAESFRRVAHSVIEFRSRRKQKYADHDHELEVSIDIIQEVINATCTRWVCQTLCGIALPDVNDEKATAAVATMHDEFTALYTYIFRDPEPEKGWSNRKAASAASKKLSEAINKHLRALPKTELKRQIALSKMVKMNERHAFRLTSLLDTGKDDDHEWRSIVCNTVGLVLLASVGFSEVCARAVDFYLDNTQNDTREEIVLLSRPSPVETEQQANNKRIMSYIREAQDHFPGPEFEKILGMELLKGPSNPFVEETMPELFKTIFQLKNLRRDWGRGGRLQRVIPFNAASTMTEPHTYLDMTTGETSCFPQSLFLTYDGDDECEPNMAIDQDTFNEGTKTQSTRTNTAFILIVALLVCYIMSFKPFPGTGHSHAAVGKHEVRVEWY